MSTPVYTVGGQPVSNTSCGQVIEFDVPGYEQAWVIVAQDGRITFDGPMPLPMQPYQLRCPQDVGNFQVAAYALVNGSRGNLIGATRIQVSAAPVSPGPTGSLPITPLTPSGTPPPMGQPHYTPPMILETGGPGTTFIEEPEAEEPGFFASLDLTTVALIGVAALVVLPPLLSRRRG